ncbi:MAG TPA: hypothetical protein VF751_03895 [Chthoniobacterales bacterium]
MIKKLFCGVLTLMLMASVVANAAEPVGIEVRMRNSIGRLGVLNVHPTVKTEADGTMVVSFQAPEEGTYVLVYTTGRNKGKTATRINVGKPGPVTTKIKMQP